LVRRLGVRRAQEPRPIRGAGRLLTPGVGHADAPRRAAHPGKKSGQRLFSDSAVGCATCHDPKTEYTTRALSELSPLPLDKKRFDKEKSPKYEFKIPSLAFIGGTAPYYHDGSIPTLELLIDLNGDRMGHTKQLSKDDRAALVAFLRTL